MTLEGQTLKIGASYNRITWITKMKSMNFISAIGIYQKLYEAVWQDGNDIMSRLLWKQGKLH